MIRKNFSALMLVLAGVLITADQFIKAEVFAAAMKNGKELYIPVIKGVFAIQYETNTGIAFGFFKGQKWLLIGLTSLLLLAVFAALIGKWFRKAPMVLFSLTLLLAGGTGNLIDRVARGFVVDYLYFELIEFAIFNLADALVTIGIAVMAAYVLFFEKGNLFTTKQGETK